MSNKEDSPASLNPTDNAKKDCTDDLTNKHQRFNLRKTNLAPLNKDHSRGKLEDIKDSKSVMKGMQPSATATA